MDNEIRQSIIKTVLYSDIFDYPLTYGQVWKYLLSPKKIKRINFEEVLKNFKNLSAGRQCTIVEKEGWYFLKGREKILKKRTERKKESEIKITTARNVTRILSAIPSVFLIGVSGGVSLHNADKNDDIDLFVITKENSLWQTRLLLVLLLKIMGKHRSRKDVKVKDKICLNMLVSEKDLAFPKDRQDIYTAHEIVQMTPIFNRNKTYEKFMSKNLWVRKYMPNAIPRLKIKDLRIKNERQLLVIRYWLLVTEFVVKQIQLWYIKRHIGKESISEGTLAFHPFDYKKDIIQSFEDRVKKYGPGI